MRGYWWAPDGARVAATRVDERPVRVWYISDPTDPEASPRAVRYPRAGTDNAIVTLHVLDRQTGEQVPVEWDRDAFEYLARVEWRETGLTLQVQSRDQRRTQVLEADPITGSTEVVREDVDPDWIDLVEGVPSRLDDGRLVVTADADDTRRLVIDGEFATRPGLQVRRIIGAESDVVFTASEEPTETHVWRLTPGGEPEPVTVEPGVHTAARCGDMVVVQSRTESDVLPTTRVLRGPDEVATIAAVAQTPVVDPLPSFAAVGTRQLRTAVLLPGGAAPEEMPANSSLPVLLDPYGGPHFQRVIRSKLGFVESQWFAEQGFAVLVVDGRGTPGRGPAWEREVRGNFLVTLDDQVDALHAAAELYGFLDLSRVAIRGWSFGGELAAAAALRRPDVFHAAISGAPVTVQDLYDTHYTERYLGHPSDEPENYRRSSLVADAAELRRPLLLIHGVADDNVVVAHSLRMSAALFEAGRRHELMLLPNLTHMASSDAAEQNLPLLELEFLRRSLGLDGG
jgi:dipeptidyl-peptidase 4